MKKDTKNIKEFVWKMIDTDISLKKNISKEIINIRALANYIIKTQKINASLDAVISAIRRYKLSATKKEDDKSVYNLLKQARINTRTKMASILLKRTDEVKTNLGRPDKIIDYQSHEIIRVIEGKEVLTLLFDRKNFEKIINMFPKKAILRTHKEVGMLEIDYPLDLEKTPGVFNIISNELAQNNISIIDAVMSSNEHILIVDENNLIKSFEIVYNLSK